MTSINLKNPELVRQIIHENEFNFKKRLNLLEEQLEKTILKGQSRLYLYSGSGYVDHGYLPETQILRFFHRKPTFTKKEIYKISKMVFQKLNNILESYELFFIILDGKLKENNVVTAIYIDIL